MLPSAVSTLRVPISRGDLREWKRRCRFKKAEAKASVSISKLDNDENHSTGLVFQSSSKNAFDDLGIGSPVVRRIASGDYNWYAMRFF